MASQISLVTKYKTVHVFAPSPLVQSNADLPTLRAMATIFGLDEVRLHIVDFVKEQPQKKETMWAIVGFGAVAREIIYSRPFGGVFASSAFTEKGAIAYSGPLPRLPLSSVGSGQTVERNKVRMLVGIIKSDFEAARALSVRFEAFDAVERHVVLVRPVGFGSMSSSKMPAESLNDILGYPNYIWIVGNHRNRQVGRSAARLSALHVATRFARSIALLLKEISESSLDSRLFYNLNPNGFAGLIGAARYLLNTNPTNLIASAVSSMVSVEYNFQTAKKFLCFWPKETIPGPNIAVQIGRFDIEVEVRARPISSRSNDVIVLAVEVERAFGSIGEFFDLCTILLQNEGLHISKVLEYGMIQLYEEKEISIYPVLDSEMAYGTLHLNPPKGSIIVCREGVPEHIIKEFRMRHSLELIHYSQIRNALQKVMSGLGS